MSMLTAGKYTGLAAIAQADESAKAVMPLVPEKLPSGDKSKFIQMELKAIAGGDAETSKYKKFIRKFDEGSVQQWIEMLQDLDEIFTQDSIDEPVVRAAIIKTILQGESKSCFESAMEEQVSDDGGDVVAPTIASVQSALDAVADMVFPHRALELQKNWMQRGLRNPRDFTAKKTLAAITCLNNALPKFPSADENVKFSEAQIIGILEYALPKPWRRILDFKGFVPSENTKLALIKECETIERSEILDGIPPGNKNNKRKRGDGEKGEIANHRSASKKSGGGSTYPKKDTRNKYYCIKHGHNLSHNTNQCWDLNLHLKKKRTGDRNKFSKKVAAKESNMICDTETVSRAQLITKYEQALKQARLKVHQAHKKGKQTAKKQIEEISVSSSSEDEEVSVHAMDIDEPIPRKKKARTIKPLKKAKKSRVDAGVDAEEAAFLAKVKHVEQLGSDSESDE